MQCRVQKAVYKTTENKSKRKTADIVASNLVRNT